MNSCRISVRWSPLFARSRTVVSTTDQTLAAPMGRVESTASSARGRRTSDSCPGRSDDRLCALGSDQQTSGRAAGTKAALGHGADRRSRTGEGCGRAWTLRPRGEGHAWRGHLGLVVLAAGDHGPAGRPVRWCGRCRPVLEPTFDRTGSARAVLGWLGAAVATTPAHPPDVLRKLPVLVPGAVDGEALVRAQGGQRPGARAALADGRIDAVVAGHVPPAPPQSADPGAQADRVPGPVRRAGWQEA